HHVELLHPMIEAVCVSASVGLGDIDAVAVDVGPGLFTGIRVGVSAAKGLALALGVPAVGVTSLDALRHGASEILRAGEHPGEREASIVPVVDLRRGDVAWSLPCPAGHVGWGPAGELLDALRSLRTAPPSESEGTQGEVVLVGGGALRYAGELASEGTSRVLELAASPLDAAPVASVAVLAVAAVREGRAVDAARLAPCYLREADARINWTTRHDGAATSGR
ncbi:MAG: tRNA (adenosine(37)-N6)-threonylcarbamoyltransferase complex dimerization subunit type 1 TsaB, partial [Acidimicrobiales bacterium]